MCAILSAVAVVTSSCDCHVMCRYFQCPPRHGLFAPLPKVEKQASAGSPANEGIYQREGEREREGGGGGEGGGRRERERERGRERGGGRVC